jgi:hypothetical protein
MKTQPKTPTIAAISKATGISRQSVSAWVKDGLNLADRAAVAARVAQARGRETGREDYQQARLRKISAEADRQQIAAKKEAGELVLAAGIFAEGKAAGLAFRQALEKLTHDLPPLVAGRPASEVFAILKREHRSLLEKLRDTEPHRYLENLKTTSKP